MGGAEDQWRSGFGLPFAAESTHLPSLQDMTTAKSEAAKDPHPEPPKNPYDAIIIGGGPGGSTAGSTLAQAGKRVLIIEREHFPRFHIGESLIPYANEEFRAIGVWEKLEKAGFMPKLGAEFVLGNSRATTRVLFARYLSREYANTFQVERSRFDNILLDHARLSGCEVWKQTRVHSVSVDADGARVSCIRGGETLQAHARWLLDASGRDALLGKHLNLPRTDLGLPKKFATFAHFRGVLRNEPPADGHITVVRLESGWCWIIPLDVEKTSVGLVQALERFQASGKKPGENFEHTVASTNELRRRIGDAVRLTDYYSAADYTYRYLRNAGPRWLLIGDAAGFIDPIFSSGVMLAVKSGRLAAGEVLAAEESRVPLSLRAQRRYTRRVGRMCKVFLRMIRMFYDNRGFEVFMTPRPPRQIECAVNNLVAGNTNLGWRLRLMVWFFYLLCSLQKYLPVVPRLVWDAGLSWLSNTRRPPEERRARESNLLTAQLASDTSPVPAAENVGDTCRT
jgi:flavin-dependent dehydrogenase